MVGARRISAKVPVELYDRLSQAAQLSDRSMSWVIDQALQSYLDQDEARHCATLAALADVDAPSPTWRWTLGWPKPPGFAPASDVFPATYKIEI